MIADPRARELNPARRCKFCAEHDGTEPWHGTRNGYKHDGCRCRACTASEAAQASARYHRHLERAQAAARARYAANSERHRAAARAQDATPRGRLSAALRNASYRLGAANIDLDAACAALLPARACAYCGRDLGADWQLEHMLPLSRGGAHELANLALSCPDCNLAKRRMTAPEYLAWLVPDLASWPEGANACGC